VDFTNLSAHSPPMAAAAGPQKAVHDSSPRPVHVHLHVFVHVDVQSAFRNKVQ
jgi:hypothetical protein